MWLQTVMLIISIADLAWVEQEAAWVDRSFFAIYKSVQKEDYLQLICRNWGRENPVETREVDVGRKKARVRFRKEIPAQIGNCAYRDKVDLHSYAVYADNYTGGLIWPEPPPKPSKIEVLSLFAEFLFM